MTGKTIDRSRVLPRIYAGVASGRSLNRVLRDTPGMPDPATFWRWHMEDENIRDSLARARLNGVERLMDDCVDIADTQEIGEVVTEKPDGTEEVRREDMLGHRKLRIETRLKYAQMIAPRKYGPKLDMTSGGDKIDFAATIAARRAQVAGGRE